MRLIPYIFASLIFSVPALDFAHAQASDCAVTGISSEEAPPPLPDYDQPPVPGPGYAWTPGYWAYNNVDYYWVPGTWVEPPRAGYLWTPPYWGYDNGVYAFHHGYWADRVGFYGGVDYGYGYGGRGFEGGRWDNGQFYYNRAVTNVRDTSITNVYDKNVVVNEGSRVSYNGGRGGLEVRPTGEELAASREPHMSATHLQTEHLRAASLNGTGFASMNHGRPGIAATARPGEFKGAGVLPARTGHRMESTAAPEHAPATMPEHGAGVDSHVESHMDRHNGAAGEDHVERHNGAAGVRHEPLHEPMAAGHEGHLNHVPGTHEGIPAGHLNAKPKPVAHAPGLHETEHRPNPATLHGGEMHAAPHGEPGMNGGGMHGGEMHAAPRRAPEVHGGGVGGGAMHGGEMHGGEMHGGEMHGGEMHGGGGAMHGGGGAVHPGGHHPDEKH